MLKGRDPGGSAAGDGERLGDELGSWDEGADCDPEGAPLDPEPVLPDGEPELPGVSEPPGIGVAVAGNEVALGVGLGVGRGVGTGVGGGVCAVTTICPVTWKLGFASPVVVD